MVILIGDSAVINDALYEPQAMRVQRQAQQSECLHLLQR